MKQLGLLSLGLIALWLLPACTPPGGRTEWPKVTEPPVDFPSRFYRRAHRRKEPVYRIDPARSRVTIRVRRAGLLSALGHNHLVATRRVQGFLLEPQERVPGRIDLFFPVTSLQVDEPELVRSIGFGSDLPPEDRAATRANMLGKVLEADRFPYVRVHVGSLREIPSPGRIRVRFTIHGVSRAREIRVHAEREGEGWTVTGKAAIRHDELGMEPFTAMGGALRVKQRLDLRFRLEAVPIAEGSDGTPGGETDDGSRPASDPGYPRDPARPGPRPAYSGWAPSWVPAPASASGGGSSGAHGA